MNPEKCVVCREKPWTVQLMIPHERAGNFLHWVCCDKCAEPYIEWKVPS